MNTPNYYAEYLKEKGFEGVDVSHGFMEIIRRFRFRDVLQARGACGEQKEYFVAQKLTG
ncbi:MAG: hypothetical protein ACLVAW_02895 [Eisenbergiella massiliensis]